MKEKNQMYIMIEHACVDAGITKAELARRLGMTPQAFYQRLTTGKFTYNELLAIANALGQTLYLSIGAAPAQAVENK